jgi:hypothetical protein
MPSYILRDSILGVSRAGPRAARNTRIFEPSATRKRWDSSSLRSWSSPSSYISRARNLFQSSPITFSHDRGCRAWHLRKFNPPRNSGEKSGKLLHASRCCEVTSTSQHDDRYHTTCRLVAVQIDTRHWKRLNHCSPIQRRCNDIGNTLARCCAVHEVWSSVGRNNSNAVVGHATPLATPRHPWCEDAHLLAGWQTGMCCDLRLPCFSRPLLRLRRATVALVLNCQEKIDVDDRPRPLMVN